MTKKTIIISTAVCLVIVVAGLLIRDFSSSNASFSAQFADNVLRPLLGNKTTIKIEAFFFNAQDKFQQLTNNTADTSQVISVGDNLTWKPVLISDTNPQRPLIQISAVNPDPVRKYVLVYLAKLDTTQLLFGSVAGKKEPASEVGNPGPGVIPDMVKQNNSLIAAFNGGFQYRDGQYGMIVDGKTYLPLRDNLATLVSDKQGKLNIVNYHDHNIDPNQFTFVRQNGEMLIENGQVIPSSNDILAKAWGRSITSSMYTWRSGVGITADGNLVYAAGNSLIPETLGKALLSAGAVNAMQLDINQFWVRFSLFKQTADGFVHQSLFSKMYDGGKVFLQNDNKDFFYIYLKDPQEVNSLTFQNLKGKWTAN
jgi:hypothetical protein